MVVELLGDDVQDVLVDPERFPDWTEFIDSVPTATMVNYLAELENAK